MTLNQLKKDQKKELKHFKKLASSDPEAAKDVARDNLRAAGIITASGKLVARYR